MVVATLKIVDEVATEKFFGAEKFFGVDSLKKNRRRQLSKTFSAPKVFRRRKKFWRRQLSKICRRRKLFGFGNLSNLGYLGN